MITVGASSYSRAIDFARFGMEAFRATPRQPDLLSAFTIQPIMFVLLFVYVFGGTLGAVDLGCEHADIRVERIRTQSISLRDAPPGSLLAGLGRMVGSLRDVVSQVREATA